MLNEATVTKFKGVLRGPVIQPKDATYDDARKLYNAMIDKRPLAIAGCVRSDATASTASSSSTSTGSGLICSAPTPELAG